jgi:hypothetical protein
MPAAPRAPGAGVRKPPMEETARGVARWRVRRYGDLMAVVPECEHNFCDMARTLRMRENTFRRPCNLKELRVGGHILQLLRYLPDGSLCTASAEQIFPRDSVQRNFCVSDSIGAGIRNCPRRRCRRATFGALPTLSVRDRAIIVLNDHRFWGYTSGPSLAGNTLPSSTHGHAARRSALPRERFRA